MDKDNDYRYAALNGAAVAHVAHYYEQRRLAYRLVQCQRAAGVR